MRGRCGTINGFGRRWRAAGTLTSKDPVREGRIVANVHSTSNSIEVREVPGAPGYLVSRDGRVYCWLAWQNQPIGKVRLLRFTTAGAGYLAFSCSRLGRIRRMLVHRAVALAFLPAPEPGQTYVRHLNGNRLDNRVENLAWGTPTDNSRDALRHGRTPRGQRNGMSKLNPETIRAIRKAATGPAPLSYRQLAKQYGLALGTVGRIIRREMWGHVED